MKNSNEMMKKNKVQRFEDGSGIKLKEYSAPVMIQIGAVNQVTMGGQTNPNADSGSNYTS